MIKFLRHIRQQLLSEGKTAKPADMPSAGRYFKYAIGEILMVTGDKENTIKAYEKSLDLNPDNENTQKVLSEIK